MKKSVGSGLWIAVIVLMLKTCAGSAGAADVRNLTVTDGMKDLIASYANEFAFTYPNELNVAHEVRVAPGEIYYNEALGWYAVTAVMPAKVGVYGVVLMDEYEVFNVFSIDAASEGELARLLKTVGYTR